MGLTSIADQKTPGRPVEITFAAQTGLPSANQELLLIGHQSASGGSASGANYVTTVINNVADPVAAKAEAEGKFGVGTELAKMVLAAVNANALTGGANFPTIKCVPLAPGDAGFGSADAALTEAGKQKAEFIASCYDGNDGTTRDKLKTTCASMSGAQRVHNNQFGTIGVVANMSVVDPSTLPSPDSQYLCPVYKRDTQAPAYSVGELAAAAAAMMAGNAAPFNPQDKVTIGGVAAPTKQSDWITVGAGMESETVLAKGWTPLRVKPNGEVAFVRTITSRITSDGTTPVSAYYDVQDFQVLYYWRKTLFTRLTQPDLMQVKASSATATLIKGEVIRLASTFEDQGMFQAVAQLAKKFQVARSTSDRHRFDIFTPVNVIPGLHLVAANIQATTEGDVLSI